MRVWRGQKSNKEAVVVRGNVRGRGTAITFFTRSPASPVRHMERAT